jgi:hypothetical protein
MPSVKKALLKTLRDDFQNMQVEYPGLWVGRVQNGTVQSFAVTKESKIYISFVYSLATFDK